MISRKARSLVAFLVVLSSLTVQVPGARARQPTPANSGPSLSDTLDWIKQTLSSNGAAAWHWTSETFEFTETYHQELDSTDGCRLSLKEEIDRQGQLSSGGEIAIHAAQIFRFTLQDIDPVSVGLQNRPTTANSTYDGNFVVLTVTNNQKAIMVAQDETIGKPGHSEWAASTIEIPISSTDIGNRMVNALIHAVELCGGKKSLF